MTPISGSLARARSPPDSLARVRRRHANVRDDDIGPVTLDRLQERGQVGAVLEHFDLVRLLLERAADPFADQERVLRDNDAVRTARSRPSHRARNERRAEARGIGPRPSFPPPVENERRASRRPPRSGRSCSSDRSCPRRNPRQSRCRRRPPRSGRSAGRARAGASPPRRRRRAWRRSGAPRGSSSTPRSRIPATACRDRRS